MKLGAMTNPRHEPLAQISWMGRHGFDFVDLAVEPPGADIADLDPEIIRRALSQAGVDVIVHTSPFLPIASRHPAAEQVARDELLRAIDLARAINAALLTVHYLGAPPYYAFNEIRDYYVQLLDELCAAAGSDLRVALENSPRNQREVLLFVEIFRRAPAVRLLLDVGHANLNTTTNRTQDFLFEPLLGGRLSHVHLSDNDGRADLHLPLGSMRGGIDWPRIVELLRKNPYDGTITLEVFSPDQGYLLLSRDKFRAWWEAAG